MSVDNSKRGNQSSKTNLGDLQESVIMAAGQDEETGMPKMQVEQNFEYKEEIQFRGEQVTDKSQKKAFNDVNRDRAETTKETMKAQLLANDRSKSGMDKLVSGHMDDSAGAQGNDFMSQSRNKAN